MVKKKCCLGTGGFNQCMPLASKTLGYEILKEVREWVNQNG